MDTIESNIKSGQLSDCDNKSFEIKAGDDFKLKISSFEKGIWRIQSKATEGYDNVGVAQLLSEDFDDCDKLKSNDINVEKQNEKYILTSSKSKSSLEITLNPFNIKLLGGNNEAKVDLFDFGYNSKTIQLSGSMNEDERMYGTGQRFNAINQRGKDLTIWAEDKWAETEGNSYVAIPIIVSTNQYALFFNRHEASLFDLGSKDNDKYTLQQNDAALDLYLFDFEDPRKFYTDLGLLLGYSPNPPEWAFGMMVCSYGEYGSKKSIRWMADKMKENDLPWNAVITEGWNAYDIGKYEEMKEISAELHDQGRKFMIYDSCGRLNLDPKYDEDVEKYAIQKETGGTILQNISYFNPADAPVKDWMSKFIDVTNPEALSWWKEKVWDELMNELGVDGAKIDFCEQLPETIKLHSGRNPKGMHHYYPVKYNYEMYKLFNRRPEGGVCFSRGGGIGAHKYPFIWAGDQRREFNFLKAIVRAAISSGISGVPFMTHDLAGYSPASNGDNEPDVFVRGTEFACFTFNMQTHGQVTKPFNFEAKIVDIFRLYTKIHYALIPYIIEQSDAACKDGIPIVRHMYMHYPNDSKVWDIEDQYFFGEDILVAPVLDTDDQRDIYIPEGEFKGLFDGKIYKGPCTLENYQVPKHEIPVFVKTNPESKVINKIVVEIKELYKGYKENI